MFGVSWPELMIVAVVTVLVVGPKELPRVLRTFTMFVRKAQGLAHEFSRGMEDLARQADLDDLKKEATKIEKDMGNSVSYADMDKMLDPDNQVAGMFTGTAISSPSTTPAAPAGPSIATPTAGQNASSLAKNVTALESAKVAGETAATTSLPAAAPATAVVTADAATPPPEKRRAGA